MDSSNWSDFLATPPNFGSCSPSLPYSEYLTDSSLQPPTNYIISSSQYSNIFPSSNQNGNQGMSMSTVQQPTIHNGLNSISNTQQPIQSQSNPNLSQQGQNNDTNLNNGNSMNSMNSMMPGTNSLNSMTNLNGSSGNILNGNGNGFGSYQEPYSEIENRSLLATNLNPNTTLEEIQHTFDPYNSTKNIDTSNLHNGQIIIEYYDLRHAQSIKRATNGIMLKGNVIIVAYAPLQKIDDPRKPPNNGTIVVFHLPTVINDQHIESSFGAYGEIRQIRGTPSKPTQRFIEFWDTRAAEAALNNLSGKYVMGSRVSIEFSLPGGFRRNVQRVDQSVIQKF
ncbi:hypothetical protein TRFO_23809 [Tritrichomonas foetus]|uniref:RRM domain-containing protein n=1 Tax=Tritrichomonas foetus TaxID=1144522 RepID=A0A1J4KDR8_9EUKA|nr:hypothetical protein TRFO_23809 [Tritrichomonas foetus]|eukprot:OHT07860.1 hypothetical protein TRFO_23809 [Tritrichomonas foetus]